MSFGLQVRNAAGELTFDSEQENVLFYLDEHFIDGSTLPAAGLNFDYPAQAGQKIAAFLTAPYQIGNASFFGPDSWLLPSCRVTYPGGIPRVTVYFTGAAVATQKANGYLVVFATGASQ